MGKTITPTYRIEVWDNMGKHTGGWHGKATVRRLENYIYKYIDSLKFGGVNYHISKLLGYMPIPNKARIIRQRTGEVVAEWKAPTFMAFNPKRR